MTKSQARLVALIKKKAILEMSVEYRNNKITVEARHLNYDEQAEFKKIRPYLIRQFRHLFEENELKKNRRNSITFLCYPSGGVVMTQPLWYYFEEGQFS